MDNITKKRKRSENWSLKDKNLLRELCTEAITVIENKCVDTNTNQNKKDCWIQITKKFNYACDVQREVAQVQLQWENMKLKAKAAESAFRKAKVRTGGGPPPKSPSREDQQLINLIPQEFNVDFNEFDSDGAALKIPEETIDENYDDLEILNESEKLDEENQQDKFNVYLNVSQPELPKKTEKKKRKMVNDSNPYKRELFELTRAHMIEEHNEKIKTIKIEQKCHQQKLENLQMESFLLKRKM